MKKIILHHLLIILLLSSLSSFSQLNGVYTIGGATPDYTTVISAAADLSSQGISGTVRFKIRTGIYNGIVYVNNVSGTSISNQIIFESETGNPSDVVINNNILAIQSNYTNFLTLKNLTVSSSGGGAIEFLNGTSFVLDSCIVSVSNVSSGSYAMTFGYCSNTEVKNTSISGYHGIAIVWADNIKISKSNLQTVSTSFDGGSIDSGYVLIDSTFASNQVSATCLNVDSVIIKNNDIYSLKVNILNGAPPVLIKENTLKGLVVIGTTEAVVSDNFIKGVSNIKESISPYIRNNRFYGGVTFENSSGTTTNHGLFVNNFISIKTNGTFYAFTLRANCNYIDIINNNIYCSSPIASSAIFRAYVFTGANNRILNNNCVINNLGNFYDYGVTSSGYSHIDYNNLYYKDVNGRTSSFPYHSSFCWNEGRKQSGFDINSMSVDPIYTNDSLLYPLNSALDSAGFNVGVIEDIDGNSRDIQFPDIGAVEFNKVYSPLSGVYSIGAFGDFLNFVEAIDSLEKVGAKDSVIFEIESGVYTDEIVIHYIKKYSNSTYIKFISTSSNVSDVKIKTTSGIMLTFIGASGVIFENISFRVDNISYIYNLMKLAGDVDLTFNRCNFYYGILGGFYQEMIRFNECNNYSDSKITFKNDSIISTNFVMNLIGNDFFNNNITISNCFISDYTSGGNGTVELVKIERFSDVNIINNKIYSYGDAVILNYCNDSISISHNIICTNTPFSSRSMLIFNDCNTKNGNAFNNFLVPGSVMSNVISYGIELFNSDSLNIMHNSIKGKHSVDISLFSSNSYSCKVYNNILMNNINVDSLNYFDYNDLGSVLYGGISYGSNLSLLQSSTGTNQNSINQTPTFVSTYDLHISNPWLRIGQPAPLVTNDIDQEGRHPVIPYVGADEYCQHPFSSFTATNTCNGDTTLLINNSSNLDSLNSLMWDIYADGSFEYTGPNPILFFFDSAGTYPVKIYSVNTNGCADSTIINITIGQDYSYNQTVSICQGDSISLYGIYQNTAGIYYDSLQTIQGCDSILSSTLSVNPLFSSNQNNAICQGDSLLIYGIYQNTAGTYYDSLQTINGCDSILSTTLAINSLPSVSIAAFNPDTLCNNGSVVVLPAGSPVGGSYSGSGVVGGNFDPAVSGVGTHDIIYTYTDGNLCINSDTTVITVDICTGIDNMSSDFGIIIYPNPNTGQFTIEKPSGLNKEVQVKLLDATSKLIQEKVIPIQQQKVEMDITKYSKGIYYIQLIVDNEVFVKQILKN